MKTVNGLKGITLMQARKIRAGNIVEVCFISETGSNIFEVGIVTKTGNNNYREFMVLFDRPFERDYFNRIPQCVEYSQIIGVADKSAFDHISSSKSTLFYNGNTSYRVSRDTKNRGKAVKNFFPIFKK